MTATVTYSLATDVIHNTLTSTELLAQIRYLEQRLAALAGNILGVPERSLARTYECVLRHRRALLAQLCAA